MQVTECQYDLGGVETCTLLPKALGCSEVLEKIAAGHELEDHVEVFIGAEGALEVDDEGRFKSLE